MFLVLHLLHFEKNARLSAFGSDLPNESNGQRDTSEVSRSLFSYRDDPFAEVDRWSALSHKLRREWTATHQVVDPSLGIRDVLKVTKRLTQSDTKVHIDVQIVASDFLSAPHKNRIQSYASGMRPSHHGTALELNISFTAQSIGKRVFMILASQGFDELMKYLEQVASSSGSANVLFVILNSNERNETDHGVFVGNGKVASMLSHVKEANPDLANLMRTIEVTAEKIYHPLPLYFPISVVQDLRVELVAYTPGRDHKAQWLEDFAWDQFEANLRSLAVYGQRLRFSSLQVNADCPFCAQAFRGIENPPRNFLKKAASLLPKDTTSEGAQTGDVNTDASQWRGAGKTLRLYVVDTYMLRPVNALERLERAPLSLFPGMAIIAIRSSNRSSITSMQALLARGFLGSAFGVGNPDTYISKTFGINNGHAEEEASSVVFDVSSRNLIRSICERRVRELEDIARSILYFDVDPAKSLGVKEYSSFWERLNILLYKLMEAQKRAGSSSELHTALYLALSTQYDMKSLRGSFDIEEGSKTVEKFRDPTLRCHFSRLKRETLRASRMLESRHPSLRQTLIALASLTGSTLVWWLILEQSARLKAQHKSE